MARNHQNGPQNSGFLSERSVVLTSRSPFRRDPTRTATGEWRNGRRAGFRCQCPSGRGGSSPPSPTESSSAQSGTNGQVAEMQPDRCVCGENADPWSVAAVGDPGAGPGPPFASVVRGFWVHESCVPTKQKNFPLEQDFLDALTDARRKCGSAPEVYWNVSGGIVSETALFAVSRDKAWRHSRP